LSGEKIQGRYALTPQDNYQAAFELAGEHLRNSDLVERCAKSGAVFEKSGTGEGLIKLLFLNQTCEIRTPRMEMGYTGSGEEIPIWAKILILHYLNRSKGLPLSGEWITFRQVPGGTGYYPAYVKRALNPLVRYFGFDPKLLIEAARPFGGWEVHQGDAAITISAFPHVPLTFIIWKGDEEFPPQANILFDSTITGNLSTEDIEVLCQMVALKMGKMVARRAVPQVETYRKND
jgi:hypothetical protein